MDTILATAFGIHAVDLVAEEHFDSMVAMRGTAVEAVELGEVVAAGAALVGPGDELVHTSRSVGIYMVDSCPGAPGHPPDGIATSGRTGPGV